MLWVFFRGGLTWPHIMLKWTLTTDPCWSKLHTFYSQKKTTFISVLVISWADGGGGRKDKQTCKLKYLFRYIEFKKSLIPPKRMLEICFNLFLVDSTKIFDPSIHFYWRSWLDWKTIIRSDDLFYKTKKIVRMNPHCESWSIKVAIIIC